MKNLFAIIVMALLPGMILAQGSPLAGLYDEFVSQEGFETTEIRPGETSFDWEKDINAPELMEAIRDISSVRILEYNGEGKMDADKVWKKMQKAVDGDQYREVMSVKSETDNVRMFMVQDPRTGHFTEIALIARESDGVTMVSVTGDIDLKKIMNPAIMENLREMGQYHMKGGGECGVK
jgi:hypothetical protein